MKTLKAQELQNIRRQRPETMVINVLGEDDYRRRHIPGSKNIPLDRKDFATQVEQMIGGKDKPVVVHCSSTTCESSSAAARKLEESGFKSVYEFEGGIAEWAEQKLPLEGEKVHV